MRIPRDPVAVFSKTLCNMSLCPCGMGRRKASFELKAGILDGGGLGLLPR